MTAKRCPGKLSSPSLFDRYLSLSGPAVSQSTDRTSSTHAMGDCNDCDTSHDHLESHTSVLPTSDEHGHGDVREKNLKRPNTKVNHTSHDCNCCDNNHDLQRSNASFLPISDQRGHGDVGKKGRGKALLIPNTKQNDTSKMENSFSGVLTRGARERLSHLLLPPGVLPTTPSNVCKTGTPNLTRSECSHSIADKENGSQQSKGEPSITAPDVDHPSDEASEEQDVNTNARRRACFKANKSCKGKGPAPKPARPPPIIKPSVIKALNLKPVELHLTQSNTGLVVTYRPWVPAYSVNHRKKCQNKSSFNGQQTKPRRKLYRDFATSPRSLSPEPTRSRSPLLQCRMSPKTKRAMTSHSPRSQSPHCRAYNYSPLRRSPTPGPSWRPDELTRTRSESPESSPHDRVSPPHEKTEQSGHTNTKRGRNRSVSPNRKSESPAKAKVACFGRQPPSNSKGSSPSEYRGKRTPSPNANSSETAIKEANIPTENRSDRHFEKRRSRSKSHNSFASEGFATIREEVFSQPDDPKKQSSEKAASQRDHSPRRVSPASRWRPPYIDGAAYFSHGSRSGSPSCSFSEESVAQRGDPRDSGRNRSPSPRRRHRHHHRRRPKPAQETESSKSSWCLIM